MQMENIFEAASCAQSLSAYLNSLEAEQDVLGIRVQALAESEFDAGLRALQQASRSEVEAASLLREARARFNKALRLETGLRLAHAHVALALCHANLGDGENAGCALLEAVDVSIPPLLEREHLAKTLGVGAGLGIMLSGPLGWLATGAVAFGAGMYRANQEQQREAQHAEQMQELKSLQKSVRKYLGLPLDKPADEDCDGTVETCCPDCGAITCVESHAGRVRVVCPKCSRYFGVDA